MPPWEDRLFQVEHSVKPSMLGTFDSSCSQVSTSKIISTSFEIQLSLGPLFHGKPRQFQERIRSMFNFYWLLSFWFLSRIKDFLLLIIAHFPSFLASFTFWTSFINFSWSSGMRSSFMNIPVPFRLEVLLSMSCLWSVELTFMQISLPLFSVNFPNLVASVRHNDSICNLLCSSVWAKAKVLYFIKNKLYRTLLHVLKYARYIMC